MNRYFYGLIAILLSTTPGYAQLMRAGVSPSRYEKLKKGINIDNWLVRNADGILAATQFTDADLEFIKQAGFKHVRFPIRSPLMNEQQPEKLNQRDIDCIKSVLNRLLNNGLTVVFDPFVRLANTRPDWKPTPPSKLNTCASGPHWRKNSAHTTRKSYLLSRSASRFQTPTNLVCI